VCHWLPRSPLGTVEVVSERRHPIPVHDLGRSQTETVELTDQEPSGDLLLQSLD
jgi:hypothetical protein